MQLTKTQSKSNVKASFDTDTLAITSEIAGLLSDPAKCLVTLAGKNAASTTTGINCVNGKYFSLPSGMAPANGYGNANVSIDSYALSATPAELSANNSSFIINFQNKNMLKGTSGASTIRKTVNLNVEVDDSDNIIKCRALSLGLSDIWSRGAGSTIYYTDGTVGIGTATPQPITLDVNGVAAFGASPSTKAVVMTVPAPRPNPTVTGWDFATSNHAPLELRAQSGAQIYLDTTGNVGVGTLAPAERLDLGGGNIKMGWECILVSGVGVSDLTATCTGTKRATGGSCRCGDIWSNTSTLSYDNAYRCISQTPCNLEVHVYCSDIR